MASLEAGLDACYCQGVERGFAQSRRLLGLLGLCLLAVAGLVVALVVFGGHDRSGSRRALPTTGAYAPISVLTPTIRMFGGAPVGDREAMMQTNLSVTMSRLPGSHRYQLIVTNTSSLGIVHAFQWYASPGVQLLKVIGSSSGRCVLSGLSGFGGSQFRALVLYPNILCEGLNLKPPTCTCRGNGGDVRVSFVADRDPALVGSPRVISATPLLKIVPSYQQ
jgi:hypothetical protein